MQCEPLKSGWQASRSLRFGPGSLIPFEQDLWRSNGVTLSRWKNDRGNQSIMTDAHTRDLEQVSVRQFLFSRWH
ncbi:hypothetical protein MPTK2_3g10060 [Marchantia polymorpha subsp. ruderalis]